ncbi:MAG: hypothetical protein K6G16_08050 [Lachnospiraceae bacterium]|nr:hypothetical protein [Lachnospiraceae bacterium]
MKKTDRLTDHMSRKCGILMIPLILTLAVSGCGKTQTSETKDTTLPSMAEPLPQDTNTEEKKAENDAPRSGNSGDQAETEGSAPADDLPDEIIENNGGYFVRVGDRVWYRIQPTETLGETSLFGGFLSATKSMTKDMPVADLCWYDLNTREFGRETDDNGGGFGPLYYAKQKNGPGEALGGFYSNRFHDDETDVYWFSIDGSEVQRLSDGSIEGVTDNGTLIVSRWDDQHGQEFVTFSGGRETGSCNAGDGSLSYCGQDGSNAYVLLHQGDIGTGTDQFVQFTGDGKQIILGQLPPSEDEFAMAWPECEDFAFASGSGGPETVYLVATRYEGTGHFVNERRVFAATPGQKNSLKEIEPQDKMGDDWANDAKLDLGGNGQVSLVTHCAGELALSDIGSGDLMFYETPSTPVCLVKDFLSFGVKDETIDPNWGIAAGDGKQRMIENMAYVGGCAFCVAALAHRAPEEDIGWRESYALDALEYYVVPVRSPDGSAADGRGEVLSLNWDV